MGAFGFGRPADVTGGFFGHAGDSSIATNHRTDADGTLACRRLSFPCQTHKALWLLPAGELLLAPQSIHVALVEALTVCENLPASHAVQVVVPLLLENVPASHAAHSDEPLIAENLPAGQREHTVAATTSAYLPIWHGTHGEDPFTGLKVP